MARCVMYAQCEKSIAGVAHSGLCIFRAVCLGMCFSGSCLLGDVDFGTSFACGFAWGGFAWVCETGVFL